MVFKLELKDIERIILVVIIVIQLDVLVMLPQEFLAALGSVRLRLHVGLAVLDGMDSVPLV